ncbi:hypothetical protein CEE39_01565 [bacterium (candidate division B38) B3_B38]|nr:MAG: hypothetical protein CEE39_01565 [bacterium (candidate division B38) B3_B38]
MGKMNELAEFLPIIQSRQREEVVDRDTLPSCGRSAVILPYCGGYSTTNLIGRMVERYSPPDDD